MTVSALAGLGFAAASTWVHYRILSDPLYSSFCDATSTINCSQAYTSAYGSIRGVPVALIGVVYFAFVLAVITLCQRSRTARANLAGYVFGLATLGLAAVLYFAYASFVILKAVCLLCVGTYAAIVALFLLSGAATRYPMTTLPSRLFDDVRTLVRNPAALTATLMFVVAAAAALVFFPSEQIAASSAPTTVAPPPEVAKTPQAPATPAKPSPQAIQKQLEEFLSQQPRVALLVPSGAAVTVVKFNDYQCPPCRQTFSQYKPVFARLQQQHPGKFALVTKDFPLDSECNAMNIPGHGAACEAAVAVRLAREKGRADAMEDWLFANQPTLTPQTIREGLSTVAGISDFDTRYQAQLQLVRGDIAQGVQLGVRGTPTFFMNGMKLPTWPPEILEAALLWELRRVSSP